MRWALPAFLMLAFLIFPMARALSVSDFNCIDIGSSSMTIVWYTDAVSNSTIFYGINSSDYSINKSRNDAVNNHSMIIEGLRPGTVFWIYASSCDYLGCGNSLSYSCKTAAYEPPVITGVSLLSVDSDSAQVVFQVSPYASTGIMWGSAPSKYGRWMNKTVVRSNHFFEIENLDAEKKYYYALTACNPLGCAVSPEYSFQTSADITPPVIGGAYPLGLLADGSEFVEMGVSTNEDSHCAFSNNSNVSYFRKPWNFNSPNPRNHTVLIRVESNRNYSFYVRCADLKYNPTVSDLVISFSTSQVNASRPASQNQTGNNATDRKRASNATSSNQSAGLNNGTVSNPGRLEQNPLDMFQYAALPLIGVAVGAAIYYFYRKRKGHPPETKGASEG